jgi:hypothetical protein
MSAYKPREQVFAVIRFDEGDGSPEDRITVKEVVTSLDVAQAEVARLNALNADKRCISTSGITIVAVDKRSCGLLASLAFVGFACN